MRKQIFTLFLMLFCLTTGLMAQTTLRGTVLDEATSLPLEDIQVLVDGTRLGTVTDPEGNFLLSNVPGENIVIIIQGGAYQQFRIEVDNSAPNQNLGKIFMKSREDSPGVVPPEDLIPVITLSDTEVDGGESISSGNISGLLNASRDAFVSAAAFTFGPRRFRIRGYDTRYTNVLINGAPMNDLEFGRPIWGTWGGLNDVMRNQSIVIGMAANSFGIGNIGGTTNIEARASSQRKQVRLSYAISNRSYTNRLMGTWSTGKLKSGWAFSLSASRRWADEGYIEGTFYNAYSYFLSVEKILNTKHAVNLSIIGAPNQRGRSTASTQEIYDLTRNNFYNPYWGYQNGEKRNSRVATSHQPIAILTHYWNLSDKATLKTAASYQTGQYGSTAFGWQRGGNPAPDYYQNTPTFYKFQAPVSGNLDQYFDLQTSWREDISTRQIDWHRLYQKNQNFEDTIYDADGIAGNTLTGKRAAYWLEERRYDSDKLNFNTTLEAILSNAVTLNGGLGYQQFIGDNFKVMDDLMGAEFHVDVDRFAERDAREDSTLTADFAQSNVDTPNRIIREGDRFGYSYKSTIQRAMAWAQANINFKKVDVFIGGEFSNTQFWRTGDYRSGRFPENSLGDSETQTFTNYMLKGGVTYKIDGRNYLFANGMAGTRAPFFRNAYQAPRVRNDIVPGLTDEKIQSIEGGFLMKSPYLKMRLVGYYTEIKDQFNNRPILFEGGLVEEIDPQSGETVFTNDTEFGNYVTTEINTRHQGIEAAIEYSISSAWKLTGVAAIGQYVYSDRFKEFFYIDTQEEPIFPIRTSYVKNFRVPGTPQAGYTLGVNHSNKKFWYANLNFNYLGKVYLDFFPSTRTLEALSNTSDPAYQENFVSGETYSLLVDQKHGNPGFTMDFFGGKSWKIDQFFIYLNVGVNNILDNKNFITGGFEQFRGLSQKFSEKEQSAQVFQPRVYYAIGRNYFINLAVRF